MKIATRVLTVLLALLFVVTGAAKLLELKPSPENFARWQLSMTFMHIIGGLEVLGGLGLLIRRLAPLAAAGLIGILIGAVRTGVVFHEPPHVYGPAALIVLLGVLIVLRLKSRVTD
jgi:uncharacterized membrane protein YphA (DoxX/SURF4 family)